MEDSTPKSAEVAPQPVSQSDLSSTKERTKSSGSLKSLNSVDGFPSQISYNSNGSFRNYPPPPLAHAQNSPFDPAMSGGYPPPHMHAYQMSSSPVILTTSQPPPPGMGPYPPNGANYPVQMLNPGNGLPPTSPSMQDMNGGSNHGSRNRGYRRDPHRRSNSYNGPGSYGSMDQQAFFSPTGAPPLGPRRTNKKRTGSADFSPVAEVRKLTGSSGGSIRPPVSPSPRGVHTHNRAKSADWQGAPGLPMMPPSPLPGQSPMAYNRGVYMGGDLGDDLLHNMNANGMTGSIRSLSERRNSEDDGSDAGGEAVFLLNKSNRQKSSRRKSRTKKRHMRQHSAQLFMEEVKGTEQLPACRDIVYVLVFVFHLLVIINLGITYGNEALKFHDHSPEDSEESITIIFENLIYISGLSGVFAMVVSGLTLLLMTSIANKIVQIALILSITFSFVWGTMGIGLSPNNIVPITGIVALTLSVAYAFIVWDRIPFAAANLHAGLSGILANPGAVFVSFVFQVLALGWSVYYIFVAGGVYDAFQLREIRFDNPAVEYIYFGLLAVSYYWTLNVFLNIVQVTVADVIGKWWYTVDGDTSSRGADLNHAFFRSLFYSIGSICYGSLLVGPVRVLRQLSVFFRPADELNSLMTLHECMHCIQSALTNCVESLARRFSPWSFTYVGLYGYNITDAGLRSAELFERRGWSTIVSDELVPNVLLLITLTITGLTGVFAHILEQFESLSLTATKEELMTPFIIGALVGLVVSSVLFGIISSSVNAVIVLFATSPVDFEENHPELSEEMRSAWREVWPGCMEIMDMRGAFMDPTLNASLNASLNGSFRGGMSPTADMYATYNPALSSSIRSQSERHPLLR